MSYTISYHVCYTRDIYFAKYYGRGGDGWLGKKMKMDMWGQNMKKKGSKTLKNGVKTA